MEVGGGGGGWAEGRSCVRLIETILANTCLGCNAGGCIGRQLMMRRIMQVVMIDLLRLGRNWDLLGLLRWARCS